MRERKRRKSPAAVSRCAKLWLLYFPATLWAVHHQREHQTIYRLHLTSSDEELSLETASWK